MSDLRSATRRRPRTERLRLPGRWDGFWLFGLLVALVTCTVMLVPLLRVIAALFVGETDAFQQTVDVLTAPETLEVVLNTIVVVGGSGLLALVVGSLLAWANERTDARIPVFTDLMPLMPFFIPPIAGAVGWIILLSPNAGLLNHGLRNLAGTVGIGLPESGPLDIFSWYGLIFVYTLFQVPYVYLMVAAALRNFDTSLEEQARVSGAGLLRTIRKVTLPAVRQSFGSAILLLVWLGLALYSVPAVLSPQSGIQVLAVEIVGQVRGQYPPQTQTAVALSLIVMVAVGIAWMAQQRLQSSGLGTTLGGKGRQASPIALGKWRPLVRLAVLLYLLLVAVLPLAALVLVALQGYWNPIIDWAGFSLETLQRVALSDAATREAIVNSVLIAVIGATIGMVIASVLSIWTRTAGRLGRWVDGAIKLPPALSAIVMALGVLLAFGGGPFHLAGSLTILILAFLCLYLPQGSVSADAAESQLGGEVREAARVSGARSWRVYLKISLPLMLPGLAAGWALLFVRMTGDITAAAILAGPRNPVVGLRILEIFEAGRFAELAALSIVLTLVNCAVLGVVFGLIRRRTSVYSTASVR